MTTTPALGLTLMAANMAQKEVVFNEAIVAFDAVFRGTVISAALTADPASPALGDCYVVGASATGLWSGHDYQIAFFYNGWQFIAPPLQIQLYDVATTAFIRYEGPSTHWVAVPATTVAVINDLTDVTGSPTDGQVLTWNNGAGQWEPASPTFTSTLATLTDVNVTEGSGINGYYLKWNNGTSKWVAGAIVIPTAVLSFGDVDSSGAVTNYVCVYDSTGPKLKFIPQSSLSVPTTLSTLSHVADVSYAGLMTGDYLQWNGAAWGPSSSVATFSFSGMSDGPGTMTGHANEFLVVNNVESALAYESLATLLSTVTINLHGLSDVPGSIGTTGQVLAVNAGATGFDYVTPSNALEIDDNATLVDAAATKLNFVNASSITTSSHHVTVTLPLYTPLVFKDHGSTSSPTVTSIDFEGTGVAVTNTSGALTVTINSASSLATLTDVNVTEGAGIDGYVLKWNNGTGRWIASATGGGSSTLAADTDVVITSPSDNDALVFEGSGVNKWRNLALGVMAFSHNYNDLINTPVNASYAFTGLSDVTISTGSGVDGYVVYWDNGAGKFKLKATGGGATTLAADTDVTITTPANGDVLTYDTGSSKWTNQAPAASPSPHHTPPLIASLTAFTRLNSATLTDRVSGAVPSLHVKAGGTDSNNELYGAFEAAPGGSFSMVVKVKTSLFGTATGWNGAGLAVYNSGATNATALWMTASNGPALWAADWSGNLTSGSPYLGTACADGDYYLHLDYDGTNVILGFSRNGLDYVQVHSVTLASALVAITDVGIFWGGSATGMEHDFLHFHVGALGTNGL